MHGAWDYFKSNASSELIEQLLFSFKVGKLLEKLLCKFKEKDEVSIKRDAPLKYHSFLSRRKNSFLCKIQQNTYDLENEAYCKNIMSYGDYKLEMQTESISHIYQFWLILQCYALHVMK